MSSTFSNFLRPLFVVLIYVIIWRPSVFSLYTVHLQYICLQCYKQDTVRHREIIECREPKYTVIEYYFLTQQQVKFKGKINWDL